VLEYILRNHKKATLQTKQMS